MFRLDETCFWSWSILSVKEAKVSLHVVVAHQTIACQQFVCLSVVTNANLNLHFYFSGLE